MKVLTNFFSDFSTRAFSIRKLTLTIAATAAVTLSSQARSEEARLIIGGTGTALGGMRLLAQAFSEDHPDIKTTVLPSLGSGGGIKALIAQKIDLSLSARPLKEKESGKGLSATLYARTPIVFATHKKTPADGVDLANLPDIYSDTTSTWPDGTRLRLVLRPEDESDTQLLRSLSTDMDKAMSVAHTREGLLVAVNDQDNATALEKVPGSLGLTTLGQILSEKRNLKALEFNGKSASLEALRSGEYPYFKELYLVMGDTRSDAADAFVSFVFSEKGRAILNASGYDAADPDR